MQRALQNTFRQKIRNTLLSFVFSAEIIIELPKSNSLISVVENYFV